MTRRGTAALAGLMVLVAPAASGQDYVLRLDSRAQTASYRGIRLDSIPALSVVPGPSGGPSTPSGFAVTCVPGRAYCTFFRPGTARRGGPWVTSADLRAWGVGVQGLSLHVNSRVGMDLGSSDVWPGTDPAVQLIEGYAEYASERMSGRLGRQVEESRLGYYGFDGARVTWRAPTGLRTLLYGGLGLARATAVPVTSAALNPLDNFQPRQRQWLLGAAVEWHGWIADARADYVREVDRDTRNFVSERAALSATLRPAPGLSLVGGAEYDFAYGWWGNADLSLRYGRREGGAALGIRRYRPYFDLWTIWGAFSPVPYRAVNGSVWVMPTRRLTLRASGERYDFDNAEASTPLVSEETRGWRWSAGLSSTLAKDVSVDGGYHFGFGPGASSQGGEVAVSWQPVPRLTVSAEGGHLVRPLEFREENPALTWYGLALDFRATERLRLSLAGTRYDEDRRRGDASGLDWSQTRLRAGLSWLFGSDADRLPLPPARPRERGR